LTLTRVSEYVLARNIIATAWSQGQKLARQLSLSLFLSSFDGDTQEMEFLNCTAQRS